MAEKVSAHTPGPVVMTFEQFAAHHKLTTTADVQGHIHAGLRSKPLTKTYARWNEGALRELQDKREEARALYAEAVADGRVRPPSEEERLHAKAGGHPDNPSTQAAINVLKKREERRAALNRAERG